MEKAILERLGRLQGQRLYDFGDIDDSAPSLKTCGPPKRRPKTNQTMIKAFLPALQTAKTRKRQRKWRQSRVYRSRRMFLERRESLNQILNLKQRATREEKPTRWHKRKKLLKEGGLQIGCERRRSQGRSDLQKTTVNPVKWPHKSHHPRSRQVKGLSWPRKRSRKKRPAARAAEKDIDPNEVQKLKRTKDALRSKKRAREEQATEARREQSILRPSFIWKSLPVKKMRKEKRKRGKKILPTIARD